MSNFFTEEPPRGSGERRLAVLGSPIEHSRSPQLHLAAYRELGLDWDYSRWEIPKGGLKDALSSRGQGWGGFSVTAPHKAEALEFVREASADAVKSGAVNTIVFDSLDPESGAVGENTDIPGALDAFAERGIHRLEGRVDVLGSGGTASSLAIAAQRLGASEVRIWGRRPEAAAALAEHLGGRATSGGGASSGETGTSGEIATSGEIVTSGDLADWQLDEGVSAVIDTVPGGYAAEDLEIATARIPSVALFSAAYSPWPTPLASHWLAADGKIVTGLDLLLHQAVRQVRLFSGRALDEPLAAEADVIAAMRASLSSD